MALRWFPTYRFLVIKQCYDAGVRPSLGDPIKAFGCKFVFHCHFLVHEDTGLMRNVILVEKNLTKEKNTTSAPNSAPTSAPTSGTSRATFIS